jgi:hypothetical protein
VAVALAHYRRRRRFGDHPFALYTRAMNSSLTATEARVIGCLIEKQITTPDQYPLSLNALVNACNQKSNRDPVLELDEQTVQQSVDALVKRHLILEKSGFGSRVPKFHQIFCNTEFGSLKFTPIETAIVCELLVRGAQTPGELRGRANRMAPIQDVSEVEAALEQLANRPEGALVARLPREPGRRDSRYAQLFTGPPPATDSSAAIPATAAASSSDSPRQSLELRVATLERALADLQEQFARLKGT